MTNHHPSKATKLVFVGVALMFASALCLGLLVWAQDVVWAGAR